MHNDRDWIRKTLSHQETDAAPYYFDFTPPARRKVEEYYGSPIEDALKYPVRMTGLKTIKPLYADPAEFGGAARDEFGVVWSTSKIDRGVPIRPCLDEPDLSRHTFPDVSAPYRFENLPNWCAQNREHYTIIWVGDLWERATFMRGMENLLLDLVLHPMFVDELLRGIADRILGTMEILFDRYTFDGIAVSDDYGAQDAMLMSPSAWRRFVRPPPRGDLRIRQRPRSDRLPPLRREHLSHHPRPDRHRLRHPAPRSARSDGHFRTEARVRAGPHPLGRHADPGSPGHREPGRNP